MRAKDLEHVARPLRPFSTTQATQEVAQASNRAVLLSDVPGERTPPEAGRDVDEFTDFYNSTYRQIYRVVVPLTLDRSDTEDVLQETYAVAARDWDKVQAADSPLAWVRRVAMNRAMDLHRKRYRRRSAYSLLRPEQEHVDDLSVEVFDALRRLPIQERQVVVLHHLLDLPVEQIALEVERPSGTVKAQLVRGRRRLAETLRLEEAR